MQLLPSFYLDCRRFVRLFPTRGRGVAATLRPPISVCRRLRCSSCRAHRFWPTSARWRKATAAPIAGRCSASAGLLRAITSATFWTRRDPALLQPCFERYGGVIERACRCVKPSAGWAEGPLIALDGTGVLLLAETRLPALSHPQAAPTARPKSYHCLSLSPEATVVGPGPSKVVPLAPEFIAPQDGAEKQDCELSVNLRFIATTPSGAGSPSTARGWRRCAPCSSATICSPATPSPR